MLSWAHIGLAGLFGALLVGGFGTRPVSCKTPINLMFMMSEREVVSGDVWREYEARLR